MHTVLRTWRQASGVHQLGLASLGLLVLAVGYYLLVLTPAHARKAALEARLATLQRELGDAHARIGELARHRQERARIERRLGLMAQRLSTTRELPPLYQTLHEAAAQTGLGLALFRPKEPRVESYYTLVPIALTAQGTYHRLGEFLARIAHLHRVVTIEELRLTAIERPQASLRAEMTVTAYVYRPVGAPPPAHGGASSPAVGARNQGMVRSP